MHTPLDGFCCCKRAQSIDRLEQARRREWQRVPGETSQDPLAVDLAPNSGERDSQNGLGAWKAEAEAKELGRGGFAHLWLGPEARLRWPARRKCGCGCS